MSRENRRKGIRSFASAAHRRFRARVFTVLVETNRRVDPARDFTVTAFAFFATRRPPPLPRVEDPATAPGFLARTVVAFFEVFAPEDVRLFVLGPAAFDSLAAPCLADFVFLTFVVFFFLAGRFATLPFPPTVLLEADPAERLGRLDRCTIVNRIWSPTA